jgi:hypothetical protein
MATQLADDLQAEAPPSKRARSEQSQDHTERPTPIGVMDDICSTGANTPAPEATKALQFGPPKTMAVENSASNMRGIPGLGLLRQTPKSVQEVASEGKAK